MLDSNASCVLPNSSVCPTTMSGVANDRRVAVNAAFLEEIKEDNVRLKQILRAVARVLQENWLANGLAAEFGLLITALRYQLGVHFDLEEVYGYLDHAVETAPELAGLAESAQAEHWSLRAEINRIDEQAHELLSNGTLESAHLQLVPRLRSFCRRLDRHEHAENELIMRAYAEDVGIGD